MRAALWCGAGLALLVGAAGAAPGDRVNVVVRQERGVDPQVDYAALREIGPWDDRNYLLRKEDLELLGPNEREITDALPAFFRVMLRKANPKMPRDSDVPYPLSAGNGYDILYGGYQYEGKLYTRITRIQGNHFELVEGDEHEDVAEVDPLGVLNGEVRISTPFGGAESAIAINPVNPNIMVAGSNGPNPAGDNTIRQKMWYSTDGGETWARSNPLSTTSGGNVCCDPTVAWSTDGTKAYGSALINCGTSCGIRFYRSDDFGVNWGDNDPGTSAPPPVDLAVGTADKQFIHVDASSASPHIDVVHICYHESNVNKYQRSTDFGVSFSPKLTVDSLGRGVGCDVTTDRAGNVYYVYPSLDSGDVSTRRQIRVAKSTDGGVTFGAGVSAGATNDAFNYALPSMETRKVAKIVQADADISTGPFSNSVYVIWPDITAAESATPANNHSQIIVGYSRDGGATWNTSIPHETADVNTVDRYQPSIKVDDLGRVHVIYYDTRHSVNRNGVDVYYNISYDGAQTWGTPRRITTETSVNINDSFEFGDYSHMDGVLDQIIAVYTDNRAETVGGAVDKDIYGVQGFADPFAPTFVQSSAGSLQRVCAGSPITPVALSVRGVQGFNTPVTLSTPGLPGAITGVSFSVNPVTPSPGGSESLLNATVAPGAAAGPLSFNVRGTSGGGSPIVRDTPIQLTVQNALAGPVALGTPAAGATNVPTVSPLTWTALAGADGYTLQLATHPDFTNATEFSVSGTQYVPAVSLQPMTTYHWRVKASNSCGEINYSPARSFTTANEICFAGSLAIPDNNATGISSTLAGFAGNLNDLNIRLKITHTWVGDLQVSLRKDPAGGPAGTPIFLMDRPGVPASTNGCSADNVDVTLDDAGTAPVENACNATPPAISGVLTPNAPLSTFTNTDFAGNWVLTVADRAGSDLGNLTEWCLLPDVAQANPDALFSNGFED